MRKQSQQTMRKPLKTAQAAYMMSQSKVRQLVETEHADRVQNIIKKLAEKRGDDKNLMWKIREKIRSEKEAF